MPEGLLDGTENQSQPDPLIDVFTPEGHKAKLPQSQYQDALRNRYEPAVRVTSPEGKAAWVPRSKAGAAITSGLFKLGPPEQQKLGGGEVQAPGDKSGVHSTAPASSGLLGVSSGLGLPESEHPIRDIADSTQIIKPDTTLKAAIGPILNPVLYAAKTGKGIVDASVEHFKQAGKDLQDSGIPVSDMISHGGNLAQPQGVPMPQAVQSALSEVGQGRTWDQLSAQEQELVKWKALHAAGLPEWSATGDMNFPLAMRAILHAGAGAFPIVGHAAYEAGTEIGEAVPKGDVDAMLHGSGKGVGLVGGLLLGTERGQAATEAAIPKIARPVARGAELVQSGTSAIASKIGEIARPNSALEPVPAAIKSLKPRNSIPNIKDTLASALPDARRAADNLGIEVKTLDDGQKAVTQAKKDIWNEYQARLGPHNDAVIDGNRVADAMESTITKRFEQQNPSAAQAIRDKAAAYRKPISLSDAEDFLQDANNELSSYYAKNKVSRRVVARDSSTGHTVAEADALRNGIYGKLDELTGPGAADLKRRYGALATMEDILQRRINVADRAAPESLIEQMGSMRAAGKIAKGVVTLPFTPVRAFGDIVEGANNLRAARASRLANDSNALLEHAFNKTAATPAAQPYIAPPRPPVRGLLPPAPTELPAATEPINPGREGLLPAAHRVDENGKVQYLTSPAEPGAEPAPIAKPSQEERGIKAPQKRTFLRSSDQDVKEFYNYRFDQLRGEIKAAQASGDANALADAERRLKALDEVQRAHPRSEPEEAATPTIARPGDISAQPKAVPAPEIPKIDTAKKVVPMAAKQTVEGSYGADTQVKTSSGNSLPAKYKVVEADSLIPSHNAQTFAKNPQYPEGVQERAYHTSKEAQNRVIQQAQNYDPAYTVNTNPDAVNGPPVVTKDGIVLGGNSRTMSTQRLYKTGGGDAYREAIAKNAAQFGVTPEQVNGMKQPVLVREVQTPANIEEARRIGADLNKSMTGAMGTGEKAVSAGRSVKPETLSAISGMVNDLGENATLRDAMRQHGKEIISKLVNDGVISERERPQFVDTATGGLNDEGKTFVERALIGSVVDDPRLMDAVPKSVLGKLEGSLGDLASVGARTDEYNLLPLVREALQEHAEMAMRGLDVNTHLAQQGMFGPARNPAVDVLVRGLAEKSKTFRAAVKQYSQDAKYDVQGQGSLGLGERPTAAKAFNDAFGANLTEEEFHDALLQSLEKESNIGGVNAGQKTGNPATDEGVRGQHAPIARPGAASGIPEAKGSAEAPDRQGPIDLNAPKSKRKIPPDATAEASRKGLKPGQVVPDQTTTKPFKDWFGESKVVDEQGKPLVVYHGTSRDVATFDKKLAGKASPHDPGLIGPAFYFTNETDQAGQFAESAQFRDVQSGKAKTEEGANVVPVYLSMKNPLRINDGVLPNGQRLSDIYPRGIEASAGKKLQADIKKSGHDGVILSVGGKDAQYVVFEPTQIKSATGNKGTFNPKDPKIINKLEPDDLPGKIARPNQIRGISV